MFRGLPVEAGILRERRWLRALWDSIEQREPPRAALNRQSRPGDGKTGGGTREGMRSGRHSKAKRQVVEQT